LWFLIHCGDQINHYFAREVKLRADCEKFAKVMQPHQCLEWQNVTWQIQTTCCNILPPHQNSLALAVIVNTLANRMLPIFELCFLFPSLLSISITVRNFLSIQSLSHNTFFSPIHLLPSVFGTATWHPVWSAHLATQALRSSGGLTFPFSGVFPFHWVQDQIKILQKLKHY
jgi:hypothetical protein